MGQSHPGRPFKKITVEGKICMTLKEKYLKSGRVVDLRYSGRYIIQDEWLYSLRNERGFHISHFDNELYVKTDSGCKKPRGQDIVAVHDLAREGYKIIVADEFLTTIWAREKNIKELSGPDEIGLIPNEEGYHLLKLVFLRGYRYVVQGQQTMELYKSNVFSLDSYEKYVYGEDRLPLYCGLGDSFGVHETLIENFKEIGAASRYPIKISDCLRIFEEANNLPLTESSPDVFQKRMEWLEYKPPVEEKEEVELETEPSTESGDSASRGKFIDYQLEGFFLGFDRDDFW